jgi:Uma2 family endonuclease
MKAVETHEKQSRAGELWPLSVAACRALGEAGLIPKETELLYGQVYQKMSKSPYQSALVRRFLKLLRKASLPGRFVTSEQPITCEHSEPEPDIAVVRGVEEDFWDEHPRTAELVVEICVTSHEFDRGKLQAYATAGVKECWLVLGPERQIEVFLEPRDGRFTERTIFGPGGRVQSTTVPEFGLELDALFGR